MSPIRTYPSWNKRPSDSKAQIEPYRWYYFLCEGRNTEYYYFTKFIDKKKEFGISSNLNISYLIKEGSDKDISSPKKLFELIEKEKKDKIKNFDQKRDKFIIIFDADTFESQQTSYNEILQKGKDKDYILGVTNPSFELFLLLHYENTYEKIIKPNYDKIIKNEWVGTGKNKRYITYCFSQLSRMNPKSNSKVGRLVDKLKIAIKQEKKINNDITNCKGKITSNIGYILEQIINDKE